MDILFGSWPALILAALISATQGSFLLVWFLRLPGTVIHELLHWIVGVATAARPSKMSLWPQRDVNGYTLGHVMFLNIRWFNGVFVGLAPLGGLVLFWVIAQYVANGGFDAGWEKALAWYAMACLLVSSWPSPADWRIALHSWPMALFAGVGWFFVDWKTIHSFF